MTMEYCSNGDMFNIIKKTGRFCPQLTRYYFHQLLNGVEHIHSRGQVAHLDLKLENLLIDKDFTLKICDFGFAEDLSQPVKKSKGTPGYKAPEIHQLENKHTSPFERVGFAGDKADFFALGVILFIMEFGIPPFALATEDNSHYRLFYRGPNNMKYFFKMHPATKEAFIR